MIGTALQDLTVTQAKAALDRKEFSPTEYVEALLAWQAEWPTLNAYTQQDVAAIREAASREPSGPLGGIPIGVKDNLDVAGYATTAGTPALRNHRPAKNAPLVQELIDRGAIIMGKLGLHEMAAGGTCANITFGPVRNPYNLDMVPGGSSGGTGAAVAARIIPAGLGTDTAGSVRAPAAMCGCVGFRPTTGRYSRIGLVPGDLRRDTIGWLARSCADVELLDANSGVAPSPPAQAVSLRGLRLGVPRAFFYAELDPDLERVIEEALARLRGAGAELVEADIPLLKELMEAAAARRGNQVHNLEVYIKESGATVSAQDIIHGVADPQLRAGMERGLAATLAAPPAAETSGDDRAELKAAYAGYFRDNRLAAFVIPTVPEPAYPTPADYMAGGTGPTSMIRNSLPGAQAGVPGLSIPAGLTSAGLPVGIEFDGPTGSDLPLLKIGQAFEAITAPLPAPVPA